MSRSSRKVRASARSERLQLFAGARQDEPLQQLVSYVQVVGRKVRTVIEDRTAPRSADSAYAIDWRNRSIEHLVAEVAAQCLKRLPRVAGTHVRDVQPRSRAVPNPG